MQSQGPELHATYLGRRPELHLSGLHGRAWPAGVTRRRGNGTVCGWRFCTGIGWRGAAASQANIAPTVRRSSMPGRNSVAWKVVACALSVAASCGVAAAQGAPPPPAVSVTPATSPPVSETIDYTRRLAPPDKGDLAAHVP